MQAATARIADLEAELAEMKDRWMRAEAETANVRARAASRGRTRRASTPCRNSPRTWSRRPRTCTAASTACRPRRRRAGDRRPPARGPRRHRAQLPRHPGAQRHQARGPDRHAVRPQPAPGDGRAGERRAPARQRDAGLDAGLDAERPAAAPGHGGGRQGAARRDHGAGPQRSWTPPPDAFVSADAQNPGTRPLPGRPHPHTSTSHLPVGTPAVLRAARVR